MQPAGYWLPFFFHSRLSFDVGTPWNVRRFGRMKYHLTYTLTMHGIIRALRLLLGTTGGGSCHQRLFHTEVAYLYI